MKQFAENTKTFAPKGRAFPVNSWRISGLWLVGSAGLVFGIVVLGGLTRLTESGLSITEWKPVTGSIPPLNQADWEAEFERYKDSPEFKLLNSNITLDEFKFIYFMEWAHRLWGRAIGLTFVIPAAYFVYARKVSGHTARRLLLISGLIGLQGFIGWWMVKSGLNQDFLHQPGAHPRVSQYRLATHLGAAFLVYIAMFNTGMDVLRESKWVKDPIKAVEHINILKNPALRSFRLAVTGLAVLAFITSMSGAFVAGLDAGLIYNSFPYMGERIVPPKSELMDPLYASDKDSSWNVFWKNMFENPTTVQFNHRVMAVSTFTATFAMHMWSLKLRPIIPRPVFRAGAIAMSLVTLQAALGITTLVYVVPISAAAAHQANALAFLTSVLVLAARLRLPRAQIEQLLRVMSKSAKPNAQTVLKP